MKISFSLILLILVTSCIQAGSFNPKERGDHRRGLKIKEAIKQKKQEERTRREYLKQVKIKTIRVKSKA